MESLLDAVSGAVWACICLVHLGVWLQNLACSPVQTCKQGRAGQGSGNGVRRLRRLQHLACVASTCCGSRVRVLVSHLLFVTGTVGQPNWPTVVPLLTAHRGMIDSPMQLSCALSQLVTPFADGQVERGVLSAFWQPLATLRGHSGDSKTALTVSCSHFVSLCLQMGKRNGRACFRTFGAPSRRQWRPRWAFRCRKSSTDWTSCWSPCSSRRRR